MYVPHEIFERKPLLGFLVGAVSLIFCLFAFLVLLREYLDFGRSPQKVDLTTVVPPSEMHGKWVEVTQPLKIHCEPIEIENQPEHQLFFGRVQSTNFVAEISRSPRFVVLQRSKKATCDDVTAAPLIGVLTELNPALRGSLVGRGMALPRNSLAMLLCLSCGPADSRTYLLLLSILIAASLWLTSRSWRKHLQVTLREGRLRATN